jgi:putative MATE family efflux protein
VTVAPDEGDAPRPSEEAPAAALPLNPRDSAVAITGEFPAHAGALVQGPLGRTIVRLAVPAVASMLLMTLFATADAFWVGRYIGPAALAAVSTSMFWIWMTIAAAELVSVGLTAVAARRHGEGFPDRAAAAVGDAMILALAIGLVLAMVGPLALDRMFEIMRTPPEVTALGRSYLGLYLLAAPLIFGFFAVDAGFRASGDTRTPFALLAVSVSVALILDPLLILGIGPFPELGIAGAATATIVTRGMVFTAGLWILRRRNMLRFAGISWANMRAISRIGLPTAATGIVFSLIYVFLTRTTTQFGTPALAALGIGHRVESWSYMFGVGLGAATAAIVGQNLGAGRVERAARTGWISVGFAALVTSVAAITMLVAADQLASLFTTDPATAAEGARYLRIAAISTIFIGGELVLEGALGGAGYTLPPMLTSTAITALRVPLAAWAAPVWGASAIWWVIALTAIARGLALGALWKWGRWRATRF